jgi:16S rRNA (uracil1498-N3)-methyltransferase
MSFERVGHQFAIFLPEQLSDIITIDDPIMYHRIVRVLKCTTGDTLILFNAYTYAQARLVDITKKMCVFNVITIENNIPLHPYITVGLPLLKGNDLNEAVSLATQVGVSNIQLLSTHCTQRPFIFTTEKKRLMRIVIAAAEQSKTFCMPIIREPIPFCVLKERYPNDSLFFGMKDGVHIRTLLQHNFKNNTNASFLFVVGPEADFSSAEYDQLKQWNAQGVSLGPTVLRSCTAAGLGIFYIRMLTS